MSAGTPAKRRRHRPDGDLADFAALQACLAGGAPMPEYCFCLDHDGNRLIDADDLGAFLDCLETSGPSVSADPDCGI